MSPSGEPTSPRGRAETDQIVKEWYRDREKKNKKRDENTAAAFEDEKTRVEMLEERAGMHTEPAAVVTHHLL